jgi:hypothetical protein
MRYWVEVTRGGCSAGEGRTFGMHITVAMGTVWRDLFGHFFLRPLALAPMRRLRIVHQRSALKGLLA